MLARSKEVIVRDIHPRLLGKIAVNFPEELLCFLQDYSNNDWNNENYRVKVSDLILHIVSEVPKFINDNEYRPDVDFLGMLIDYIVFNNERALMGGYPSYDLGEYLIHTLTSEYDIFQDIVHIDYIDNLINYLGVHGIMHHQHKEEILRRMDIFIKFENVVFMVLKAITNKSEELLEVILNPELSYGRIHINSCEIILGVYHHSQPL